MDEPIITTPWQTRHVLGQERAKAQFYQSVQSGRLGHGWLFSGARGVGKMSLALLIARAILSDRPPVCDDDLEATFASEDGHLVTQQVHPDLRVVTLSEEEGAKKSIDVDQIRELKQFFTKSAGRSRWRVAIIDAIDDMTRQAVNALLKLLEEPPAYCLLLIVNHNSGRVIDTVRSRCQKLNFTAPAADITTDILSHILPHSDPQTRAAAAYLANGSVGRSIDMINAGGLAGFENMMRILAENDQDYVPQLHQFGDGISRREQAAQYQVFIGLLIDWVHRLTRHQADGHGFQPLFENEKILAERIVNSASVEELYACWERLG